MLEHHALKMLNRRTGLTKLDFNRLKPGVVSLRQ